MTKKVQNPTYTKMIIDHLEGSNQDLENICTEIARIQRLVRTMSSNSSVKTDKEVQLVKSSKAFAGAARRDADTRGKIDCVQNPKQEAVVVVVVVMTRARKTSIIVVRRVI